MSNSFKPQNSSVSRILLVFAFLASLKYFKKKTVALNSMLFIWLTPLVHRLPFLILGFVDHRLTLPATYVEYVSVGRSRSPRLKPKLAAYKISTPDLSACCSGILSKSGATRVQFDKIW